MKPPKHPLIIAPNYKGDGDPGPPLTDQEWSEYMTKVDQVGDRWLQVMELVALGLLTVDEYIVALDRLIAKVDELQPYRDRIAFEKDRSPAGQEIDRVATQYNLGLLTKGTNAPKPKRKTFRNKLERIFYQETERRRREEAEEQPARGPQRLPLDNATDQNVDG